MKIARIRLTEIQIDTGRFQFRSVAFHEDRIQWLLANWNPDLLDPLDIWRSPEGYFLLAGHHRMETLIRRGDSSAPCRIHELTLEEAQLYALLSNANRLQYSSFEYCRCVSFLVDKGKDFGEVAEQLAISDGMARKYYSLRSLIETDWELQTDKLDLLSRAFELGKFCEVNKFFGASEIQSMFYITCKHDLTVSQLQQLLRDIRRQNQEKHDQGSLFDLTDFGDRAAKALQERDFLNMCSAQAWWLYELAINKKKHHEFPEEITEPLRKAICRFYSYCVDADEEEVIPVRATTKGRKLRKADQ